MSEHDYDVGKNHPEEHLLVPEPLAIIDTDLDASLPRKRQRRFRSQSSKTAEISSREIEARIQNLPPDMKREIGSFIKPERKFMTQKESVDKFATTS